MQLELGLNDRAKNINSSSNAKTNLVHSKAMAPKKKSAPKAAKKAPAKKKVSPPAKKAAVKKVAVKKAPVKKVIAKKAPSKKVVVKKRHRLEEKVVAKKKAVAKKKKVTSKADPKLTTIIASVDVGYGNELFIRGEGAGLLGMQEHR